RVFSVGSNWVVFHPKVYWVEGGGRRVVVVGSANATAGGLRQNFETSVVLDMDERQDSDLLEEFDLLWMSYSSPLPPLSNANLLELDSRLIRAVSSDSPPTDPRPTQPHPLARFIKPPKLLRPHAKS